MIMAIVSPKSLPPKSSSSAPVCTLSFISIFSVPLIKVPC